MLKPPQQPKSLSTLHMSFMVSTVSLRHMVALPLLILAAAVMLASAGGVGSASAAGLGVGAAGTTRFNFISMALDASASVSPFKASGLAAYHGNSVKQVLSWNAATQQMISYAPGISPPFADFNLAVGGAYFLALDSTSANSLALVGKVPDQGAVSFSMARGATSASCKFNAISLPLDKSSITTAGQLATEIGGVLQVIKWNASTQQIVSYLPDVSPPFANFAIQVGFPYFVCVNNAGPSSWP